MSLTTTPPIRISPEVGSSRPAIIRSSVVLPEPEGPRRTRNSPSRLSRFTFLTAAACPALKLLVSSLVWTMAMRGSLLPLVEDPADLLVGRVHGVLDAHLVARRLGEHCRNHPGVEDLVDGRARVARVA